MMECPECGNNIFRHDFKRDETTCNKCGLVLDGPPENTDYPFGYNFDAEISLSIRKDGARVVGFYYIPEYYRDPQQFVKYRRE